MSTREFRYVDGSSTKFWRITLDGNSHTVQFGRIGTAGQTQTKSFDDDAKAADSYRKLIDEKLRKGYVEANADASSAGDAASTPATPAPKSEPVRQAKAPAPNVHLVEAPAGSTAQVEWPPRRALRLDPADWLWATWRPRTPLPRPAAAPFNQAAAAQRLAKVPAANYGYDWRWEKVGIAPVLTRAEAHFWLTAMTNVESRVKAAELAEQLRGGSFDGVVDTEAVQQRLVDRRQMLTPEIMLPLANLFALPDLLAVMINARVVSTRYYATSAAPALVAGFRRYVLPYLTAEEVATVHGHLRRAWPSLSWPVNLYETPSAAYFLAAATGLHDEVRELVASLPDDMYGQNPWHDDLYHRPQEMVLGLGDPREVEQQMQRLRLPLREPALVRAWLAHTEYAALDVIRDSVLAHPNKETASELLSAFVTVEAPEAAPHMLQLMLDSKAPSIARTWLEVHPAHTIAGLVPVASGRGRLAEAAADLVRRLARRGHRDLIARSIDEAQIEDGARVRESVLADGESALRPFDEATTPGWLAEAIRQSSARRRPVAWVQPFDLPPIVVGQQRLNDEQVDAVLAALQSSTLDKPHPLLVTLKRHADPGSLDTFAWQLFELWLAEGGPSKESWALRAVGHFGGDASVLKLTPLIRAWPGESQHTRAVVGLEVLRAIGSDTALMQINGIAQKLQFKGLQAKAREAMAEIARDRGFTPQQLEDRIVPDCDLDGQGSRSFDFGPRRFRFVLGPDLKPLVRDEAGKLKSDLPSPGAKDDPARAQQAVSEWKLLKKQVAEVAKIQVVRLEQAMVTGRRWSAEELKSLLVDHPLMTHLVQRLVWGVYDTAGAVVETFRVTEDRTLADIADEAYELDASATVGIVHPLQLGAADRGAWGELLSDYEIVQPFAQLGRPTYALAPDEHKVTEITRFKDIAIPVKALVFTLDKLGWTRGIPMDGGVFDEHSRPFVGSNVTAVVQYEGVPVGYYEGWDDQKLERCYFVRGNTGPQGYRAPNQALPLAEIDPVVVSEVLHDLSIVAAKGS